MGAWGHKNFENDDACDWVYDLEKSKDKSIIHQALNLIINNKEYLECPDCCNALAAANVVLAGITGEYNRVTDEVTIWLKKKYGLFRKKSVIFDKSDVSIAIHACKKIMESSELKELWEETEEFDNWVKEVSDLINKLENLA